MDEDTAKSPRLRRAAPVALALVAAAFALVGVFFVMIVARFLAQLLG